jgi:hypothetical protein
MLMILQSQSMENSLRLSEVLQTALCTDQQLCNRTNLSINPNKTVIIPFTRKKDIRGLMKPTLFNNTIYP